MTFTGQNPLFGILASYPSQTETRQVYNLFQEPVEQPPLDFSIVEEKIRQF